MKMIKIHLIIVACLLNFSTLLQAQQGVVVAGGGFSSAGGTSSFSIGQVDFDFFSSAYGNVTLGLQQVFTRPTGIPLSPFEEPVFHVYPNPTTGLLSLELPPSEKSGIVTIEVYCMLGSLITLVQLDVGRISTLDLSGIPGGIYMLRIIKSKRTGVMKIIKKE